MVRSLGSFSHVAPKRTLHGLIINSTAPSELLRSSIQSLPRGKSDWPCNFCMFPIRFDRSDRIPLDNSTPLESRLRTTSRYVPFSPSLHDGPPQAGQKTARVQHRKGAIAASRVRAVSPLMDEPNRPLGKKGRGLFLFAGTREKNIEVTGHY
jgi:hypothetical protein